MAIASGSSRLCAWDLGQGMIDRLTEEVLKSLVWRLAKGQAHLAENIHVETVTHKQSYSSFFLNGFVE